MPPLSSYLSQLRGAVLHGAGLQSSLAQRPSQHNKNVTLVMGNPSADLDSFVSAVVLSYFYNHRRASKPAESSAAPTMYVPILNLPAVRSSDLWRQRPEFGVAVKIALGGAVEASSNGTDSGSGDQGGRVNELEQLITIADVKDDEASILHPFFSSTESSHTEDRESSSSLPAPTNGKQDVLLVDHNSPTIPGLDDEAIKSRFNVVGCIDHHVDEGYVPHGADPRIVTTGIGSCTSLLVRHLREQGLWPEAAGDSADDGIGQSAGKGDLEDGLNQITRLALAPILIDTASLRATGDKCSDTDREAVRFLESSLTSRPSELNASGTSLSNSSQQQQQQPQWDRTAAYQAISSAKSNSLSLLTIQEAFDRDYKAWTEPITNSTSTGTSAKENATSSSETDKEDPTQKINIGITSLVKPLSWLVGHAGGVQQFTDEIDKFTKSQSPELGVFAMLTRAGEGKEVVVLATAAGAKGVVDGFEAAAGELRLRGWEEDGDFLGELAGNFVSAKVWWMGDTSKSRKQVAPLLRDVVRGL